VASILYNKIIDKSKKKYKINKNLLKICSKALGIIPLSVGVGLPSIEKVLPVPVCP